jgi:hypothetical protein
MPVQRFRSADAVPPPAAVDPRDDLALERVWALLKFATDGLPPLHPTGVHRYRSIDEAQAARLDAEARRMRALRASRR